MKQSKISESSSGAGEDSDRSFGSVLDEVDFLPLGRRKVVGRGNSVATGSPLPHSIPRKVCYERHSGMIVVEFVNDSVFMVPARALPGLVDATEVEIAQVELRGETGLHWKRRNAYHEIATLMAGTFRTEDLTATAAAGKGDAGMLIPDWVAPVIKFLADNLPRSSKVGWEHQFLTAYQIGCEALVALGQAHETLDGALRRTNPSLPAALPRQDDVAVAVIYLAAQNGLMTFLTFDEVRQSHPPRAGYDRLHQRGRERWFASADRDVTSILRLLGMLDGFEWTDAAETVLWRDCPPEWRIDFTSDPRFINAVEDACQYMPAHIREEVDRFSVITGEDIAVHSSGGSYQNEDGTEAVLSMPPKTPDQVRQTILWIRRFDFDELFYKFWRIDDGWLSPDEARRALEIFNDPLAIAVRKHVAARLYPDLPNLAD